MSKYYFKPLVACFQYIQYYKYVVVVVYVRYLSMQSVLSRLMDYFKSEQDMPQIDTHWISESGIIDVFVLFGPKPRDVFRQYSNLTGPTPLPPVSSCIIIMNAIQQLL